MRAHLISLGDTVGGERLELDFDAEGIRLVLLTGITEKKMGPTFPDKNR